MSQIEERLRALNIEIPKTSAPVGAYVPAVVENGIAYVSGQLPLRDGKLAIAGRIGADLTLEDGKQAAELCFINVLIALATVGVPPGRIRRFVRLMGHVQCVDSFHEQHLVINGASELCQKIFGDKGVHSRAALGAQALPLNAAVELEAIVAVDAE